ncbi:MAG: RAMP superfamily CRISPR-associated protein [Nitrososphaeria archaeon]
MGKAYAFKLQFDVLSPILVGTSSTVGNIKEALKVGRYYMIPSSSWKGALKREALSVALYMPLTQEARALVEEHLREPDEKFGAHAGSGCASLPQIKEKNGLVDIAETRKTVEPELYHLIHQSLSAEEAKMYICSALRSFACPLDSIFGSIYFTSLANFSSSVFAGKSEIRSNVAIDRETMAASEGRLYSEEVVWPVDGLRLYVTLLVPERRSLYGYTRDPELITALWRGVLRKLTDLGTSIGSGKSKGLGRIRLSSDKSLYAEIPESREAYTWKGLSDFLNKNP